MPKLSEYIFGKKPKMKQLPTMSPMQQQLQNMIMQYLTGGQGGGGGGMQDIFAQLNDLMDPTGQAYERFAAPEMRQFQEQTIPGLAEQFAGFGANSGALSSSGFGQSLGAAGAGLQERLAKMRAGLQQQGRQDLFSLMNQGMQTPFAYLQKPGSKGALAGTLENLVGALPYMAMML